MKNANHFWHGMHWCVQCLLPNWSFCQVDFGIDMGWCSSIFTINEFYTCCSQVTHLTKLTKKYICKNCLFETRRCVHVASLCARKQAVYYGYFYSYFSSRSCKWGANISITIPLKSKKLVNLASYEPTYSTIDQHSPIASHKHAKRPWQFANVKGSQH